MLDKILNHPWFWIGLGGFLGAISRYEIAGILQRNFTPDFYPIGTLTVNVIGSFILGLIVTFFQFNTINQQQLLFFGTGFCGAFTTFSTFAVETVKLYDSEGIGWSVSNIGITVASTLGAVIVGIFIGNFIIKNYLQV
jgi:CrcB protein